MKEGLVPDLPMELWYLISKNLTSSQLLQCRKVCREWNEWASNDYMWRHRISIPKSLAVPEWSSLPAYQRYVMYSLQGSLRQGLQALAQLFARHPPLFARFFQCKIIIQDRNTYRMIPNDTFRVAVVDRFRRYWIPEDQWTIRTDTKLNLRKLMYCYRRQIHNYERNCAQPICG